MRAFLIGGFALTVLYVLLQPGSASRVSSGSAALDALIGRVFSPNTAGVPQRGASPPTAAQGGTGIGSGTIGGGLGGGGGSSF